MAAIAQIRSQSICLASSVNDWHFVHVHSEKGVGVLLFANYHDQSGLVFHTVGPHTEPLHATEQIITTGMLCEGQRAG